MALSRFVLMVAIATWFFLSQNDSVLAKCRCSLDELPAQGFSWDANAASTGPVTLLVSLGSETVRVYRGDQPIGIARLKIPAPNQISRGVFALSQDVKGSQSGAILLGDYRWRGRSVYVRSGGGRYVGSEPAPIQIPMDFAQDVAKVSKAGAVIIISDGHPDFVRFESRWPIHDVPLQVASIGSLGHALARVRGEDTDRIRQFARLAIPTAQTTNAASGLVVSSYDQTATLLRGRMVAWTSPISISGEHTFEGTYIYLRRTAGTNDQRQAWMAIKMGDGETSPVSEQVAPLNVLHRIRIDNEIHTSEASISLDSGSVMVATDGDTVTHASERTEFEIFQAHPPLPVRRAKPPIRISKKRKRRRYRSRRKRRVYRRYAAARTDVPLLGPHLLMAP